MANMAAMATLLTTSVDRKVVIIVILFFCLFFYNLTFQVVEFSISPYY